MYKSLPCQKAQRSFVLCESALLECARQQKISDRYSYRIWDLLAYQLGEVMPKGDPIPATMRRLSVDEQMLWSAEQAISDVVPDTAYHLQY